MRAVGIKELKNQLSRYLGYVRSGDVVLVLDRDEVIAELRRPTLALPGKVSRWESFLNEQEQLGRIVRAERTTSRARENLESDGPLLAKVPWRDLLDETRAERS